MANGIAEFAAEPSFAVLLRNFETVEMRWPKGMVVAYAMNSPVVQPSVGGAPGRDLAKCRNIVEEDGGEHPSSGPEKTVESNGAYERRTRTEKESRKTRIGKCNYIWRILKTYVCPESGGNDA